MASENSRASQWAFPRRNSASPRAKSALAGAAAIAKARGRAIGTHQNRQRFNGSAVSFGRVSWTSIGVPIHCAASEPEIDAFRMAARPASNAATHASRVSRSVPSMSNRMARSLGTSRLLLAEPPDLVAHVVDRLDRLAFLLAGHRGSVHDRL